VDKELLILIAHYNNPEGLEASLLSIKETIPVDILIVDDGSSLKYNEARLQKIYPRGTIFFDALPTNQGVGAAANRALEIAMKKQYRFLGRLDCGDINYPDKYKKQLTYLNANPDVKLLGTWARVLDEDGTFLHMLKHPRDYDEIKNKMHLNSTFLNPSVVFASEILGTVGNYPERYKRAAQDFAFFFNVIKHYKAENLPEVLMDYMVESHSISTTKRRLQVKNRIHILCDNFYFGAYPIYGLVRSCILYFVPRSLGTFIKKSFRKNDD
jgi:glycosyltransferase involved in cell wall biosynthesis